MTLDELIATLIPADGSANVSVQLGVDQSEGAPRHGVTVQLADVDPVTAYGLTLSAAVDAVVPMVASQLDAKMALAESASEQLSTLQTAKAALGA